jgi:hypothetical protein
MAAIASASPEWSVLLTAASVGSLEEKTGRLSRSLQSSISWEFLFDLADRHGLQFLLHQALHPVSRSLPAAAWNRIAQSHVANLHKALLLSTELIRIVEHLDGLGLDVMPYKGLGLAEAAYGDIALRPSGDIDLLVRAQDLRRVRDALVMLNYSPHASFPAEQEEVYLKSGYELAFDGAAGPNLVELQWALLPRFYAVNFDMDGLFSRAVPLMVAGKTMKTLSPSDSILALSVHAAKHLWNRLIWICDIARLMTSPELDWQWIGLEARKLGITRIVRVTMLLCHQLLQAPVSARAEAALPPDSGASKMAADVQHQILTGTAFPLESPSYFRLMMKLRERPADRWRFFTRLLLTPGPGEWQLIRLRPSSPFYRLVRLSRLAARLVGV